MLPHNMFPQKHVRPTIDSHSGDNARLDPDIHRLVRESTNIEKHTSNQNIVSVHCEMSDVLGKTSPEDREISLGQQLCTLRVLRDCPMAKCQMQKWPKLFFQKQFLTKI